MVDVSAFLQLSLGIASIAMQSPRLGSIVAMKAHSPSQLSAKVARRLQLKILKLGPHGKKLVMLRHLVINAQEKTPSASKKTDRDLGIVTLPVTKRIKTLYWVLGTESKGLYRACCCSVWTKLC